MQCHLEGLNNWGWTLNINNLTYIEEGVGGGGGRGRGEVNQTWEERFGPSLESGNN